MNKIDIQGIIKDCIKEILIERRFPHEKWTDTFGNKMPGEYTVEAGDVIINDPKKVKIKNDVDKIKETSQPEPYNPEMDVYQPSPRERTLPSETPAEKLIIWAQNRLRRETNRMNVDALQAVIKMLKQDIASKKGSVDEVVGKETKLSNSERNQIGKAFTKLGLDGNGRFVKKEHGLQAITSALSSLGFQLNLVSADMIMGDKGSRNFIFRRANDPGQDPFTEKPEIDNSRIVFTWELLPHERYEILAYAS